LSELKRKKDEWEHRIFVVVVGVVVVVVVGSVEKGHSVQARCTGIHPQFGAHIGHRHTVGRARCRRRCPRWQGVCAWAWSWSGFSIIAWARRREGSSCGKRETEMVVSTSNSTLARCVTA
jgi:hypothetical protein